MPYCINHPEKYAIDRCPRCGQIFCSQCLVDIHGINYCQECKVELKSSGVGTRKYPRFSILKEIKKINKLAFLLIMASIVLSIIILRLKIINGTLAKDLYLKSSQISSLNKKIKSQERLIAIQEEKINKFTPERQALQDQLEKMALELNSAHMDLEQARRMVNILKEKISIQNLMVDSLKRMVENLTTTTPAETIIKSKPVISGNKGFVSKNQGALSLESNKKVVIEVLPTGQ